MSTKQVRQVFLVVHAFTMARADHKHNGVVEVLYVTNNEQVANNFLQAAAAQRPDDYFAVYPAPLDEKLADKAHYPSVEIEWEDLQ